MSFRLSELSASKLSDLCHVGLVRSLSTVPQELLPMLLKIIKNMSMAPAALEVLQNANAIEALTKVMLSHLDVTVSPDVPMTFPLAETPSLSTGDL